MTRGSPRISSDSCKAPSAVCINFRGSDLCGGLRFTQVSRAGMNDREPRLLGRIRRSGSDQSPMQMAYLMREGLDFERQQVPTDHERRYTPPAQRLRKVNSWFGVTCDWRLSRRSACTTNPLAPKKAAPG